MTVSALLHYTVHTVTIAWMKSYKSRPHEYETDPVCPQGIKEGNKRRFGTPPPSLLQGPVV